MPHGVNLILDLEVTKVDLVDEGANTAAFIKMYKRKEQDEAMELKDILAKMAPEHAAVIEAEIAKAKSEVPAETQAAMDAATVEAEKAKTDAQAAFDELETMKSAELAKSKPSFEEVIKGLDPVVQEVMKSMHAQKVLAEEQLRKAKEEADHAEATAKAKELSNLPVDEAKLVEVLKSATPELVEIFKAANQAITDGKLFEEVGKSGNQGDAQGAAGDAAQAWAQIEKKADEVAKRDNVSKEKAIGIATRENPDLYKAYLAGGAN